MKKTLYTLGMATILLTGVTATSFATGAGAEEPVGFGGIVDHAPAEQHSHDLLMASPHRSAQRRKPVLINPARVGSTGKQLLDHGRGARSAGTAKQSARKLAHPLWGLPLGGVEQQTDILGIAAPDRDINRPTAGNGGAMGQQ